MAAKCQRSRNIPTVAEGPLRCGTRGPGAWEQQGGTRAPDASFCDWERPNIAFTIHAGKECHQAVLALCWVKPSAGASHGHTWPAMHFCVVLLCAIYLQPLIEGSLRGHLKAGSAPALKRAYFVSWLVSGSGRIGCCRIGSAWEQCWGRSSVAAPSPSAAKPPVHQTTAVRSVALYCGEL